MFFDRHETRISRGGLKYISRTLSVERAFQISTRTASITRPAFTFVRVHYEQDLNFASSSLGKKAKYSAASELFLENRENLPVRRWFGRYRVERDLSRILHRLPPRALI